MQHYLSNKLIYFLGKIICASQVWMIVARAGIFRAAFALSFLDATFFKGCREITFWLEPFSKRLSWRFLI